jgi:pimeloyl-ACP methyl ester carboxylesterase
MFSIRFCELDQFIFRWIQRHNTCVRIVKVDNSGHFFPEEQPEATARELTDFFTGS